MQLVEKRDVVGFALGRLLPGRDAEVLVIGDYDEAIAFLMMG